MSDRDVVCVDMEISEDLACAKRPVSRTSGTILSGDVSGKRFSAHIVEGNVAGIGEGRCGDDKGMASAWGE